MTRGRGDSGAEVTGAEVSGAEVVRAKVTRGRNCISHGRYSLSHLLLNLLSVLSGFIQKKKKKWGPSD